MKYDVVRAMFIIGNEHGMFKAQFDMYTTYLIIVLVHFVYMQQVEDFEDVQWPLFVCMLFKSLYELQHSVI